MPRIDADGNIADDAGAGYGDSSDSTDSNDSSDTSSGSNDDTGSSSSGGGYASPGDVGALDPPSTDDGDSGADDSGSDDSGGSNQPVPDPDGVDDGTGYESDDDSGSSPTGNEPTTETGPPGPEDSYDDGGDSTDDLPGQGDPNRTDSTKPSGPTNESGGDGPDDPPSDPAPGPGGPPVMPPGNTGPEDGGDGPTESDRGPDAIEAKPDADFDQTTPTYDGESYSEVEETLRNEQNASDIQYAEVDGGLVARYESDGRTQFAPIPFDEESQDAVTSKASELQEYANEQDVANQYEGVTPFDVDFQNGELTTESRNEIRAEQISDEVEGVSRDDLTFVNGELSKGSQEELGRAALEGSLGEQTAQDLQLGEDFTYDEETGEVDLTPYGQKELAREDVESSAMGDLEAGEDFEVTVSDNSGSGVDVSLTNSGREKISQAKEDGRAALVAATSGSGELARGVDATDFEGVQGQGQLKAIEQQITSSNPDLERGEDYTISINESGEFTITGATSGEQQRRREQTQNAFQRGNYGDSQEIRKEAAARQVSDELGIPASAEDVSVETTEDGERRVRLSEQAQRAALLSSSSEFLNRDAEIEQTEDGEYRVSLPGDSDAMEEALTQKVQTGEAFGGETTFNVPGFGTVNVDQATQDFAGAVEGAASTAGDYADQANLFSPQLAFRGGTQNQELTESSSTAEASEDFLIQSLESSATAVGDVPRGLLELGEAAGDPTAYQVGAEATMMGVRRLDDVSVSSVQSAGQGAIETGERVDALAGENPEAAASVSASLLGGAAVSAATYAAAPAALSRIASASPRSARAIAATLDPVRTSARVGSRAASSVSDSASTAARSTARSVKQSTPDVSLVEDPNAGVLDVTPEARQQIRRGLSSRTPSRDGIRSSLSDRISSAKQRAQVELANLDLRRRDAANAIQDASPRDLVDGGRAVGERVRDQAAGAVRGAAFSAEAAAFNARRSVRNVDASDVLPSRQSTDAESEPMMGRVEGRVKGAAVDAGLAARRARDASVEDVLPSRPRVGSSDKELGRVEGAVASLNVNARLAARRATDLEASDMLPSRPSRPTLGDSDSLVGPVRGRALGAAASGEAAVRRVLNTDPQDVLPSRPSTPDTPNVRDLTVRVEPSRPPRTPMTRTVDARDTDLTSDEADIFDTFNAGGEGDASDVGTVGSNIIGRRPDLGSTTRQADVTGSQQVARMQRRDAPASITRETFSAGPMVESTLIGSGTAGLGAIGNAATESSVTDAVRDQPLGQQGPVVGLRSAPGLTADSPTVTEAPTTAETPAVTEFNTPTTFSEETTTTTTASILDGPTVTETVTVTETETPPPTARGTPDLPNDNRDGSDESFAFGVNTADLQYQLGADIFGGL